MITEIKKIAGTSSPPLRRRASNATGNERSTVTQPVDSWCLFSSQNSPADGAAGYLFGR